MKDWDFRIVIPILNPRGDDTAHALRLTHDVAGGVLASLFKCPYVRDRPDTALPAP